MRAIAAISKNKVLGKGGKIPWYVPEDFAFFKTMTLYQDLLMGRKTYDSLPGKLRNRNIKVLTRHIIFRHQEYNPHIDSRITISTKLPSNLKSNRLWLCGGAEMYNRYLPLCTELYLSVINKVVSGGDTFFELPNDFIFDEVVLEKEEFKVYKYINIWREKLEE